MNLADEIKRVDSLNADEFRQRHLTQGQPVVLTQALSNWDAIGKWNLDLFRQHGSREVEVEHYPSGNRCDAFHYNRMRLADYVDRLRVEPQQRSYYYLAELPLQNVLPEPASNPSAAAPHLTDISIPSCLPPLANLRQMVFLGIDTFSTAHYHRFRSQALLCQVEGVKRVCLIPPSNLRKMQLWPWYSMRANHSRLRLDASAEGNLEQFPNLSNVEHFICNLQPGDALYIPDHWLHVVQGIGENISVTYFWDGSLSQVNLRGVMRDTASSLSKSLLVAGAGVSSRLGMNGLLVSAASKLGVLGTNDQTAIQHHLKRFGNARPHEVRDELPCQS